MKSSAKEMPAPVLKNIWLQHKDKNAGIQDLMDFTIPWKTVNMILKASDIKDDFIEHVKIRAAYDLFEFEHEMADRMEGGYIEVTRTTFCITVWTSFSGQETTTMDIPIDALLQGMFCIRIENGKVVEPTQEDRDYFCEDEWEYVIAPTIEIAGTKCTHVI